MISLNLFYNLFSTCKDVDSENESTEIVSQTEHQYRDNDYVPSTMILPCFPHFWFIFLISIFPTIFSNKNRSQQVWSELSSVY